MTKKYLLGFIGQGWVGKNYADHFEDRGFTVVRYSLEEPYVHNKEEIAKCDIVFIAVPTPTTPDGFDDRYIRSVIDLVGRGKVAVIKSTIPPGTTRRLAKEHTDKFIIHAPEFLREAFARHDVDHPERVFVGIPDLSEEYKKWGKVVLDIHPKAPHSEMVSAEEAEFIKYVHNTMGYSLIVFTNLLYDLAQKHGVEWAKVKEAITNNPWYPSKYIDPVHKGGRGAGGACFIKDFATLRHTYEQDLPNDVEGLALLRAFEAKNNQMLRDSGKDIGILDGVYGMRGEGIDKDITAIEEIITEKEAN
ncbi:MAG: hypothetical protein A2845_03320 [Candidatus Lloydbacteria bacterium RIFCSPHIGHO2_01_FULL_49_22]|uniref:UDP-glucose/GDP-mannose dehydrogenase dimerisation domain-containing protein n=1 Tax=Candidatus Lloydbacteria bacterium RIFCSPHIGHO2_01_FULL_49_22 TaxID=1798658 RepID=A0A1G2CZ73_9BACT|nr:MAG: hypothetical protein A2845_03320 [Candidatus Lloydbacteria bacterium RIFCSPHIGHO2_01_FULL_49_22]OGZ08961.1 MAG: hypothetical protein A3C14_03155 [Candidatus Lloydbacteria bacterium RIFCSPHIGHO2_02_FULL_50_18]